MRRLSLFVLLSFLSALGTACGNDTSGGGTCDPGLSPCGQVCVDLSRDDLEAVELVPFARAARAGVLNLVRSMATEFAADGIRVNGILIGLVESGQ